MVELAGLKTLCLFLLVIIEVVEWDPSACISDGALEVEYRH